MTMAYKCRKCGYIVRDKRKNCPKCGQNIKKDKFKRICKHFVLLIGILILCLSGLSFFQQKRTEQVINEFLTAYKNADGEKCGELLYSNISEDPISFSETQKLLAEKMSWKVKRHFFKWKKDEQVEVQIKNLNFEEIARKFEKKQTSEEKINAAISEANADKFYNCKVTVSKYGKEYKIIMTDTLSNALFGGLNEYLQKNMGDLNDKD